MVTRYERVDEVTVGGRDFAVYCEPDLDSGPPWDECDTLGAVSEWIRHREYYGGPPKAPGERVLARDNWAYRTYGYAGAIRKARAEGQSGPDAVRVVNAEFEYLRRWCADQWHYVGVGAQRLDADGAYGEIDWLWGVEDDQRGYILETARELASEMIAADETEARDRAWAAGLGIATVGA